MYFGPKQVGVAICAAFALVTIAAPAQAQQVRKKFKDKIHVVQRKPVLQKKRFELAPRFGASFNDPLYQSFRVGTNANFHITERLFIGGVFDWYNFGGRLGGVTDTYQRVQDETNTLPETPFLNWAGALEVGFAPIIGKFALFNSRLGFYDLGVTVGGGYSNYSTIRDRSGKASPVVTASAFNHIFLNEWVSLNFEVRDTIYFAELRGVEGTSLSHSVTAAVGFGLFFPKKFTYAGDADAEN